MLDMGEYCGAYHLTGIGVECAIKACIARKTNRHEFPDKNHAAKCWEHDPEKLITVAGLSVQLGIESKANGRFASNWGVVKDWKIDCRYDLSITDTKALALYSAVVARQHGVLRWLRRHW